MPLPDPTLILPLGPMNALSNTVRRFPWHQAKVLPALKGHPANVIKQDGSALAGLAGGLASEM